jgi:streptogramin lyase
MELKMNPINVIKRAVVLSVACTALAACSAAPQSGFVPAASMQQGAAQTNGDWLTRNIQPLAAVGGTVGSGGNGTGGGGSGGGGTGGGTITGLCEVPAGYPPNTYCTCTWNPPPSPSTLISMECFDPLPIGGFPFAVARDNNYLYIGVSNGTVLVAKYANGKVTQVSKITGLSGNPLGMATDSHGNLWVTNSPNNTISEFAKGATTPIAYYTDSNLTSVSYLAIDKHNNVYVEGIGSNESEYGIEVDELDTATGTFNALSQPVLGSVPGGLAVQQYGNATYIWVNDQAGRISRYLLQGSFLNLDGSFTYSGIDGAIAVDPSDIKHVYAANNVPSGSQFVTSIVEYSISTGKVVTSSPSSTLPYEDVGLAFTKKL